MFACTFRYNGVGLCIASSSADSLHIALFEDHMTFCNDRVSRQNRQCAGRFVVDIGCVQSWDASRHSRKGDCCLDTANTNQEKE